MKLQREKIYNKPGREISYKSDEKWKVDFRAHEKNLWQNKVVQIEWKENGQKRLFLRKLANMYN